jgi:hypothetical protein
MPSLGGNFLHVNASNPSSKWMVRYAISSTQVAVHCSAKHTNVHYVRHKVAVHDRQQVDCCTGANGLWIWPLCDGAVVPTHNTALVEGEPASKHSALLSPTVEAVLKNGELLAVMHPAIRTALFFVGVYITITHLLSPSQLFSK